MCFKISGFQFQFSIILFLIFGAMNQSVKNRWFQKHPTVSFVVIIIIAVLIVDFISALIFIPPDYNSFRTADPWYHHGLLPNRHASNIWGERIFGIYTNSLGFKDQSCREIPLITEKKRIVLIGDSFTESMGMTWEESFSGIIASRLPGTEILNAGVVSYSPKLYYLKIKYLIENEKLKFDELYVFIDNSDPLNELTYEDFEPYPDKSFKKFGYNLKRYLFSHSYLYYSVSAMLMNSRKNPVTAAWNPMSGAAVMDELSVEQNDFIAAMLNWSYTPALYEKWGRRGLQLAGENMQKLADLCSQNNIKLSVVIYPWPSLIEQRNLNDVQVGFWKSFCEQNKLQFINLYPEFINDEDPVKVIQKLFIPGDVHWNKEGNKRVAEKILKYLSKD
jgi:hypothetical protein